MKYSNIIGIIAAILVIVSCFGPWVYISSIQATITGLYAPHTNFGKPGLMNIIMGVISILFFIMPPLWAKRTNLFIAAFNMAWAVRNFFLITQCELGECPEKLWGMYLLLTGSTIILFMTFFPKVSPSAFKNE